MPPHWLVVVSWTWLSVAFACALVVLADVYLRGRRQPMGIMEAVWPSTALYAGPVALWGCWRSGRPMNPRWMREHGTDEPPSKPGWATAVRVGHCGAGCTLGDVIAEFAVFGLGITIAGRASWAEYIGDFVLAVALGLMFQCSAFAPMRGPSLRHGLTAAAKADVLLPTPEPVGGTWSRTQSKEDEASR